MIEITAVKTSGGENHQHITALRWRNVSTLATGQSTTQAIVDWLSESQANQAVVADGSTWVYVRVQREADRPAFLQTYADGNWKDNLLSLPRFE